ncbi:hypothetical protein [Bacillus tuaregi]|uniref:hypothetical protein n=1 Tax=Bacillus tuaregi TaxID=1816695 RepID=UPI0008F87EC7|nr:hypothetical protein [Bacillus tuaregi]
MKKKLIIGIVAGAIILGGAGTFAFAEGSNGFLGGFGEMKPYMEKMHPELSEEQLQQMYDNCHGKGGMMQNVDPANRMPYGTENTMMNRF